jgi:hypothetical protein
MKVWILCSGDGSGFAGSIGAVCSIEVTGDRGNSHQ